MSGITILDRTNAPTGPFTRAQVAEKLQRGDITLSSLAFIDGLAQWTPLRDILARLDAATPPTPPIATPPAPPASAPAISAPAAPAPVYSYAATMEPPSHLVYAGFWIRVAAHLIDLALLFLGVLAAILVFGAVIAALFGFTHSTSPADSTTTQNPLTVFLIVVVEILLWLGVFVGFWIYHAWLESSAWQGTLGKRLMGLRITSMTGERITFWHATGRFFARIVATLPFCAGYIMCAFTPRKQALHDLIASTLVVK